MSREFWYDFIQLYKSYPCLWDVKNPLYVQREIRKEAYDVLLAKVREIDSTATLDTIKKKIDCFRSTFRREEKKVLMSMQSRDGEPVYIPKLWYYRDLEEILGHNVEDGKKQSASNESFYSEDDMVLVQPIDSSDDSDYDYEAPPVPAKKRKQMTKQQLPKIFTQTFPQRKSEKDDCSTFAANLEVQMRDLNEDQKYIAQKLISDVMFLARTNRLNYNSSVNSNENETDTLASGSALKPCKNEDLSSLDAIYIEGK